VNQLNIVPGTLVALVGVSGSGKTAFASQFSTSCVVCLDAYREMATDDAADQSATPVAAQIQDLLLDARLARGLTTVVDSTNVLPHVRAGLLARARYWQRPTTAVLFDVPLPVAEAQNGARSRVVPTDVLRAQHQQLPSVAQLHAEGFGKVVHLAPTEAGAV
jgi:predicted kinase